jgi:hypothetical protein
MHHILDLSFNFDYFYSTNDLQVKITKIKKDTKNIAKSKNDKKRKILQKPKTLL